MTLRTLHALVLLGLFSLACVGREQADLDATVHLTATWAEMGWPQEGDRAVLCNDLAVELRHEGGQDVEEVAERYLAHARAQGWREVRRESSGGVVTASLLKGDHSLGVSVMESQGAISVSMVLSPV